MDAVEAFLDAADSVLNSNTFLLVVPMRTGDPATDVRDFVCSGGLREAVLQADLAREWYIWHRYGPEGELTAIPGGFVKAGCELPVLRTNSTAFDYLQAMLCGDLRLGDFFSFYRRAKTQEEARRLTSELLGYLFAGAEPSLYVLDPDFLHDASLDGDEGYYFEGKGCDNAALLTAGTTGYLILTNGMP